MTQLYLTRRQVAERYPISEHTLAKLASTGRGPIYYKPTDKTLYKAADIEAWIAASVVKPAAEDTLALGASGNSREPAKRSRTGRGTHARIREFSDSQPAVRGRKSLTPSARSVLHKADDRPDGDPRERAIDSDTADRILTMFAEASRVSTGGTGTRRSLLSSLAKHKLTP